MTHRQLRISTSIHLPGGAGLIVFKVGSSAKLQGRLANLKRPEVRGSSLKSIIKAGKQNAGINERISVPDHRVGNMYFPVAELVREPPPFNTVDGRTGIKLKSIR